jgi:hypothetical protein
MASDDDKRPENVVRFGKTAARGEDLQGVVETCEAMGPHGDALLTLRFANVLGQDTYLLPGDVRRCTVFEKALPQAGEAVIFRLRTQFNEAAANEPEFRLYPEIAAIRRGAKSSI